MTKKLFVGSLPYCIGNDELQAMFGAIGVVQSIKIIMDATTGRSKGFGFVEMALDEEADKAIQELNGTPHGGRNIVVSEAKANSTKTGGRRNVRGGFSRGGRSSAHVNTGRNNKSSPGYTDSKRSPAGFSDNAWQGERNVGGYSNPRGERNAGSQYNNNRNTGGYVNRNNRQGYNAYDPGPSERNSYAARHNHVTPEIDPNIDDNVGNRITDDDRGNRYNPYDNRSPNRSYPNDRNQGYANDDRRHKPAGRYGANRNGGRGPGRDDNNRGGW